jgi:heat-inducible transcriptional repressor
VRVAKFCHAGTFRIGAEARLKADGPHFIKGATGRTATHLGDTPVGTQIWDVAAQAILPGRDRLARHSVIQLIDAEIPHHYIPLLLGIGQTRPKYGPYITMKSVPRSIISELNDRSRTVFSEIVSSYLDDGEAVGSRTLSRRLADPLSAASVRNVMADLEELGLLYSEHTSAGRLPTDLGLRLFVDGLMEIGSLSDEERLTIESQCNSAGKSINEVLEEASGALSGLSRCAGLVVAPKSDRALKHIEFVSLGDGRALVVMVAEDGFVENRVIDMPIGTPPSALVQAGNYLNARLAGRTLEDAGRMIENEISEHRAEIDELTRGLVEAGLATWSGGDDGGALIVKGHARLLDDVSAVADLERVRALFDALDTRDLMARLLGLTQTGDGVQIFLGAENNLFNVAGCAMIAAPFTGTRGEIVGAVGVIGPARINYARIIPIVDYTARVVGKLLGSK